MSHPPPSLSTISRAIKASLPNKDTCQAVGSDATATSTQTNHSTAAKLHNHWFNNKILTGMRGELLLSIAILLVIIVGLRIADNNLDTIRYQATAHANTDAFENSSAPSTTDNKHIFAAKIGANIFQSSASQKYPGLLSAANNEISASQIQIYSPLPTKSSIRHKVKSGDTLSDILLQYDITAAQHQQLIDVVSSKLNLRKLSPGQLIQIVMREEYGQNQLASVSIPIGKSEQLRIDVNDQPAELTSNTITTPTREVEKVIHGVVKTSLYVDSVAADIPLPLLSNFINIFSSDIDFQREVYQGDKFLVYYKAERSLESGNLIDQGKILQATIVNNGKKITYFRYGDDSGNPEYYDANGNSARRAIVRTPLDGARISSGFGKRRHPILGYTRQHNGIDFAVPTGTPIYAAGDGRIAYAGRNKGYGIYIKIRHPGSLATAYAHLSRIAKGIRAGVKVKQNQVIGYSGNTGLSTGPHLHYEVHSQGTPINPNSLKPPRIKKLQAEELHDFRQQSAKITHAMRDLVSDTVAINLITSD